MRGAALILALACAPAWAQSPLSASFRVGGLVSFGSEAKSGTEPWAVLWTTTRLTSGSRSPLLTTATEITAAPGSDFNLQATAAFRAMRFELGLAIPLRSTWNFSAYVGGGLKARVLEAGDAAGAETPRWAEAGLRVASTSRGWLRITGAVTQQGGVWRPAALVTGAYDVIPGAATVTLCGRARLASDTRVELAVGVGR